MSEEPTLYKCPDCGQHCVRAWSDQRNEMYYICIGKGCSFQVYVADAPDRPDVERFHRANPEELGWMLEDEE